MVWTDPGSLSPASLARIHGGRQHAAAAPARLARQAASGPVRLDRVGAGAIPGGDPLDFGEVRHRGRTGPAPPAVLDPAERQLWLVSDGLVVDVHDAGVDAPGERAPALTATGLAGFALEERLGAPIGQARRPVRAGTPGGQARPRSCSGHETTRREAGTRGSRREPGSLARTAPSAGVLTGLIAFRRWSGPGTRQQLRRRRRPAGCRPSRRSTRICWCPGRRARRTRRPSPPAPASSG